MTPTTFNIIDAIHVQINPSVREKNIKVKHSYKSFLYNISHGD
jgi:hypothetical protein